MATATATQRKVSEVLTDAVMARAAGVTKTKTAEPDARFADIASNPIYKIMFAEANKTDEAKRAELHEVFKFVSKADMREHMKELESFLEYLSNVREDMATDIIKLTDTDAIPELQKTIEGFNNDLLQFDEAMKPLTEILDAIYDLNNNGVMYDTFTEIRQDKEREAELKKQQDAANQQFENINFHIRQINKEMATLGEDRALFGYGNVKKASREAIARKQQDLTEADNELTALQESLKSLNATHQDEGKFAAQKAKLRGFLDLSTDKSRDQQKLVVETALNFVKTAKTRVGSVREHLGRLNNQVDNLFDANTNMTTVIAVLNEGIKDAEKSNQDIRSGLMAPAENEDTLAKVQREQKQMDLNQYIETLDNAARDTMTTYADLTSQTLRIKTMKDANVSQMAKAKAMHTQGIAGVADRLSVSLQAVGAAALAQSAAIAKDNMMRMQDRTNMIAQKESIRVATGVNESTQDVIKALEDLGTYGEVAKTATDITRKGLSEMRDKLEELKSLAKDTQDVIHDSIAVAAEVGAGGTTKREMGKTTTSTAPNPFNLGR